MSPLKIPIKAHLNQAKFEALNDYAIGPLFNEAERVALDYVTELTRKKQISEETFARVRKHYSERAICEIVWLVASEHFYNMSNIGLNIHSDMRIGREPRVKAPGSKKSSRCGCDLNRRDCARLA